MRYGTISISSVFVRSKRNITVSKFVSKREHTQFRLMYTFDFTDSDNNIYNNSLIVLSNYKLCISLTLPENI